MAKKRTRKAVAQKMGFQRILVLLAVVFCVILFLIKILIGGIGWFEVFAPVIIAFFILFLLSVIKIVVRKI